MAKRKGYVLVWVEADDCIPPHGLDMGAPHDACKVEMLRREFVQNGFGPDYPALVGYPLDGKIQLLSGTHRHLAAKQAKIYIPVTLWLRSDIERMWGTDLWESAIQDIPVKDLIHYPVKDGFSVPEYDRVNPATMGEDQ